MAKKLIIGLLAGYGVYLAGSSIVAFLALREQEDIAKRVSNCAWVTQLNPLISCEDPGELAHD